jgi:hypothetical protein
MSQRLKRFRWKVRLVDANRLQRSATARALLGAQFDVSVFDDVSDLLPELAGSSKSLVILETADASTLARIGTHPEVRVLACTDLDPSAVWGLFADAGIRRFSAVAKNVSNVDLVLAAERLLGDTEEPA